MLGHGEEERVDAPLGAQARVGVLQALDGLLIPAHPVIGGAEAEKRGVVGRPRDQLLAPAYDLLRIDARLRSSGT